MRESFRQKKKTDFRLGMQSNNHKLKFHFKVISDQPTWCKYSGTTAQPF